MKIHGTTSRPDTIVAVANHYKTGRGFGRYKATVMHHFVKCYPTLFVGYSGWDFFHANYRAFWAQAGVNGGEKIYFMKRKGSRGGPLISKLVGNHIGARLVIGEGILPDSACAVMKRIDEDGARSIIKFNETIDFNAVQATVRANQNSFVVNWVNKTRHSKTFAWISSHW